MTVNFLVDKRQVPEEGFARLLKVIGMVCGKVLSMTPKGRYLVVRVEFQRSY